MDLVVPILIGLATLLPQRFLPVECSEVVLKVTGADGGRCDRYERDPEGNRIRECRTQAGGSTRCRNRIREDLGDRPDCFVPVNYT